MFSAGTERVRLFLSTKNYVAYLCSTFIVFFLRSHFSTDGTVQPSRIHSRRRYRWCGIFIPFLLSCLILNNFLLPLSRRIEPICKKRLVCQDSTRVDQSEAPFRYLRSVLSDLCVSSVSIERMYDRLSRLLLQYLHSILGFK